MAATAMNENRSPTAAGKLPRVALGIIHGIFNSIRER